MATNLEFEGKNVDKAIQKASSKLKISKEELKYEVITYGSTGIFGFGRSKKAKIKILNDGDGTGSMTGGTALSEKDEIKESIKNLIDETFNDKPATKIDPETIDIGKNVLRKILDTITEDTEIEVSEIKDRIMYEIKGGNSGIIIGKHGQTLEAIHTIVEKIINKNNEKRIRINVDVEGYLEKRKNNLTKHAEKLAQKCKKIGKPVTLGQMNAHDRRIVHIALKGDRRVRTQSMGEGVMRKLVIFPKKNSHSRKRKPNPKTKNADHQ